MNDGHEHHHEHHHEHGSKRQTAFILILFVALIIIGLYLGIMS
jgi:Co/Zn/Cd efflux system component